MGRPSEDSCGDGDEEPGFGHMKYGMLIRHPSGGIGQLAGGVGLTFGGKVRDGECVFGSLSVGKGLDEVTEGVGVGREGRPRAEPGASHIGSGGSKGRAPTPHTRGHHSHHSP